MTDCLQSLYVGNVRNFWAPVWWTIIKVVAIVVQPMLYPQKLSLAEGSIVKLKQSLYDYQTISKEYLKTCSL